MPNWKKLIVSGSDAALNSINVTSALTASGLNYPSSDGTDGQVLLTDGSGVLSFSDNITYVTVKNVSSGTLIKGTPVHSTGTSGNTPEVIAASASVATSMPAGFVLAENIAATAEGRAVLSGFLNGVDTNGLTEGANVYVGSSGGYTTTKPTSDSNLIQNIAIIGKSDANGSLYIIGAGRSNDVPNLPESKIWVGSSNYTVTSSVAHLDESNERLGIGTTSPLDTLHVEGGDIRIRGASSTSDLILDHNGTHSGSRIRGIRDTGPDAQDFGSSALQFLTNDNSTTSAEVQMTLSSEGKLQIGSGFAPERLTVSGNISGSGCIQIGTGHTNSGTLSSIVGGTLNIISGTCSFIGGGSTNCVSGNLSFVGGGTENDALANCTVVVGGCNNSISGLLSSIVGGRDHCISAAAWYGLIGGGRSNAIRGNYGFIGGGCSNSICSLEQYSVIGGGQLNILDGDNSGILGGNSNCVIHDNSFIVGSNLTSSAACTTFMNNLDVEGTVSASAFSGSFVGDGSNLTGVGGSPGGSNTQVQYNNGGNFAGSSNLTFDGTNLTVGGDITSSGNIIVDDLSAQSTVEYPLTLAVKDDNNSIDQQGGEGVGIKFKIAGNDSTDPGNSLVGAGIAAVREEASDSDSSTGIAFLVSQNDETLDEKVRIDHDGKVGIGTNNPDYKLDVAGNAGINEYLYHNGDTDTYLRYQNNQVDIAAGGQVASLTTTELTLPGSLTVGGKVTATEIVTNVVSQSISFATGSNRFGDEITDTHTFTGSLNVTGSLNLPDNVKANFGDSSDLQIYHDGSNSYIDESGTGRLNIRSSGITIGKYTGENGIIFNADAEVKLYYNNSAKLETTNTGIVATGNISGSGELELIGGVTASVLSFEGTSTSIGVNAGCTRSTNTLNNVVIGKDAFLNATTPDANVVIGVNAGKDQSVSGQRQVLIGYAAGEKNQRGGTNTAVGYQALYSSNYTFPGPQSSVAIGYAALHNGSAHSNNVAVGYNAGNSIQSGGNNVLIGYCTGVGTLTTGGGNTLVGYKAGTLNSNDSNSIVIGCCAVGKGSNTVVIGHSDITNTYLQGDISASGNITGSSLQLTSVVNAGTDTDKFLVLDSDGNVDFRTGANVLSDIGATTCTGTVTGTGAANKLAIWNSGTELTSDTCLHWDTSNNRLGIGTTSPSQKLTVEGNISGSGCIQIGTGHTLSGTKSSIGGGINHTITGNCSFIGGGCDNCITGNCSFVGGGRLNDVLSACSIIAGGYNNSLSGLVTTIAGGRDNCITSAGACSFIGGGYINKIENIFSTIGGGCSNCVKDRFSVIAGGEDNCTNSDYWYNVIGGGCTNTISGTYSGYNTIGGGRDNSLSGTYSSYQTIAGGCNNKITDKAGTVGGGRGNCVCGEAGTIGGGLSNIICNAEDYATIGGGRSNTVDGDYGVIAGGYLNCNCSCLSSIGGGCSNLINATGDGRNVIAGGHNGGISGTHGYHSMVGGQSNCIHTAQDKNTVGGGGGNCILCNLANSTIGGGAENTICRTSGFDYGSTIAGGAHNRLIGSTCWGFIGGGSCNTGSAPNVVVAGGRLNSSEGNCSAILGGCGNTASGTLSGILGGTANTVSHTCSFIVGSNLTSDKACYTFMNNLDVAGTVSGSVFSGSFVGDGSGLTGISGGGSIDGSGAANKLAIWSDSDTLTSDTCLHWDTGNNRLGIGTSSPDTTLHVEGNLLVDAYNVGEDNGIFLREGFLTTDQPSITVWDMSNSGASPDGLSLNAQDGIRFRENSGEVARFKDGNFGIGETNPAQALHVSGRGLFDTGASTPDGTTGTYEKGITLTGGNMRLVMDVCDTTNCGAYIQTRHQSTSFPTAYYRLALNPLGGCLVVGPNIVDSTLSTVAGGALNTGSGACGFIGGGCLNKICSGETFGVIAGGRCNTVDADYAVIGGGNSNTACGDYGGVFAGSNNVASGQNSAIVAGYGNATNGAFYSVIAGGFGNSMSAQGCAFIGAGLNNENRGYNSAIVAGTCNCITSFGACDSFIGAGCCNRIISNATGCKANFIGGGVSNGISMTCCASILGGSANIITSTVAPCENASCNAVIVAGSSNCINHSCFAFIGGGSGNCICTGNSSGVVAGCGNDVLSSYGFVGGGTSNCITALYSTIAGGYQNCITAECSGILGGFSNCVTHNHSFAIGCNLTSTATCYTFMNNACVSGTTRTTTLVETSAKKYKECILPLEDQIENIKKLEPVEFQWKKDKTKDIGFIAEDVKEVYPNLIAYEEDGEINGIQYSKLTTVLVKALQQQQKEIDNLTKKVDTLTSKLDSLQK